jgi:hypothetical protein
MTSLARTNDAPVTRYTDEAAAIMERVIAVGDLSELKPMERVQLYNQTCKSMGLNPLTRPFEFIKLNGKLTLYARKDATDQLRDLKGVSVGIADRQVVEGVLMVTARATTRDGRSDESIGAVAVAGLKGEALANAYMKAETKAKRRVTLSICGLGWLDETEVVTVPSAQAVNVNTATGEIIDAPKAASNDQQRQRYMDRVAILIGEYQALRPEYQPERFDTFTIADLTAYGSDLNDWIASAQDTAESTTADDDDEPLFLNDEPAPRAVSDDEVAFFGEYQHVIGGSDWSAVQRFFGRPYPRPTDAAGWNGLAGAIDVRLRETTGAE